MNIISYWMINLLVGLGISIVFHELGHWLYFRLIGKKVKIVFEDMAFSIGEDKDYVGLTFKQKEKLFWSGILFGLIPIIYLCSISLIYSWIIPFYIVGCNSDIQNLKRLYNE